MALLHIRPDGLTGEESSWRKLLQVPAPPVDTQITPGVGKSAAITNERVPLLVTKILCGCWCHNVTNCWVSEFCIKPESAPYATIHIPAPGKKGKNNKVLVSHLMLRFYGRMLPTKGYQISHLCHNPQCFNPAHLVVEIISTNNKRKACSGGGGACTCKVASRCVVGARDWAAGGGYSLPEFASRAVRDPANQDDQAPRTEESVDERPAKRARPSPPDVISDSDQ